MTMTADFAKSTGGGYAQLLQSSLRKSLVRALAYGFAAVLLACGAGLCSGLLYYGFEWQRIALLIAATLGAGSLPAFFVIRHLASRISGFATCSIELLFETPEMMNELSRDDTHWTHDIALTSRQLREDLESFRRLVRRSSRKSAALITELKKAREAASSHDQAQTQFFARMSHELRTPLNAILGYATLLREDAIDRGQSSSALDLDRILAAGRNLLTIVNDMLGLTQFEAGTTTVERHVIDVRHLAQSLTASEHVDARDGLSVAIDDEIRIMIGDAAKLRQCLSTLLSTAAESAVNGVTLRITPREAAGVPSIGFELRALGATAGEYLPLSDGATSRGPRSNLVGEIGLSLAIARRLAKLMHGDCVVEEVPGVGLSFQLTLPLSPPKSEEMIVTAVEEGDETPTATPKLQRRALIVDDDEAALDLTRRWLTDMGYDVLLAHDGETGLELARRERPDLILLDGLLPGRSGYEIVAELRSDPQVGRTPVIFVTVDDNRLRGIGCGASDYIRKPLTRAGLRAILDIYAVPCAGEVLIIDDDDDAAELIRRGVEEVGFSTRRARDGAEGINMAVAKPPSAIVLDVHMPRLDGFAVIDRLSRPENLRRIPIIVVSGHEMGLAEHRRLAAAAHRVFTKGMTAPREIAQSLREAVA